MRSDLSRSNSLGNKTILFLGNSLTANAVDLEVLEAEMNYGQTVYLSTYKVVPDGTSVWDWYCILKNNFSAGDSIPDILVVGYAWGSVAPVPSRLAGYFCGIGDLGGLYNLGMNQNSDVLEYLVASVSRLYVMRETISKRILDLVIPGYREGVREVNASSRNNSQVDNVTAVPYSGGIFGRFLYLSEPHKVKTVIMAMPVIEDYQLDKKVIDKVHKYGASLLDYRYLDGISDDMFIDPIHLGREGSHLFSKRLAADLSRIAGVKGESK
jgi:hypothetical protein